MKGRGKTHSLSMPNIRSLVEPALSLDSRRLGTHLAPQPSLLFDIAMARKSKVKNAQASLQDKVDTPGRGRSAAAELSEEKDPEELRLEKLVFGDDAGFKSALAAYSADEAGYELDSKSLRSGDGESSADEGSLGELRDEDVSIPSSIWSA